MSHFESTSIVDSTNSEWLVDANGGMPVNSLQQTTPIVMLPMVQQLGANTLSAQATLYSYTVTVTSSAGMSIGNHFRIIDSTADRYYFGTILGIASNTITLDTQIDFAYANGAEVTYSNTNMNVDGSSTPVVFSLRTGAPSIPSNILITRMLFSCTASSTVDLNKFGNLSALTRGISFRRLNSDVHNIFNVKTNGDLAAIAYDWTPFVASNPAQGIDGFACRLTFAGMNKMGSALSIEVDGNLEMLVQDNLTSLTSLSVILEGHVAG